LKTNNGILQGSVAMCFRCGGIFNDRFIAKFLLNVAVNTFWVGKYKSKKPAWVFFDSQCLCTCICV